MTLNKRQLDLIATLLGAIAGICTVLATQEIGNQKLVGTIGGLATVGLGIITQRPADAKPTTEELEDEEIKS